MEGAIMKTSSVLLITGIIFTTAGVYGLLYLPFSDSSTELILGSIISLICGVFLISFNIYKKMYPAENSEVDTTNIKPISVQKVNTDTISNTYAPIKNPILATSSAPTQKQKLSVILPQIYENSILKYNYEDVFVVGVSHLPDTSIINDSLYGKYVYFEWEKDNPYDNKAIMVLHDGTKLGYLKRDDFIRDMVYDFLKREDTVLGRICFVDVASLYLHVNIGFYKESNNNKVMKLAGSGSASIQETLLFRSEGEQVYITYDIDKEKYIVSAMDDLGYLSSKDAAFFKDNIEDEETAYVAVIDKVEEDDNSKYHVWININF